MQSNDFPSGEPVELSKGSAHIPRLDEVLEGAYRGPGDAGIRRAGCITTGETTLAATFVKAACDRGEKVL